jgi:hypothetical protein
MTFDPSLELDTVFGFAGAALMAYGLGAKNLALASAGAVFAGWFGTLSLVRVVKLAELVNADVGAVGAMSSVLGGSNTTTSPSGQSQGTQ